MCVLGSIISNCWYSEILIWYNNYIKKYIPINNLLNKKMQIIIGWY